MKKLAIASIVLLMAGFGLALGQAGSCTCPGCAPCAETGCFENCSGSCALGDNAASACDANCPNGNCGSTGSCQVGSAACPAPCCETGNR
ncbi:MAG: hypothetical protein LUQ59_09955 [Methanothrix sp.]|nr:hypothetical protein [Methanothrix sp.]